jgi:hypothetical protein
LCRVIIEAQDMDRIARRKYERGKTPCKRCHGCRIGADRAAYAGRLSLWSGRARLSCEPCLTRSWISRRPARSGGCCRRTFLDSRQCKAISAIGKTRARLRRLISSCSASARSGGPSAEPNGGVIDSQSVKTTESAGPLGGACLRAAKLRHGGCGQEGQRP